MNQPNRKQEWKRRVAAYPLFAILLCFGIATGLCAAHPQFLLTPRNLPEVKEKIRNEKWAAELFASLRAEIDRYAALTEQDPRWLSSRLSMYRKKGERYTQCYIIDEIWSHGEGDAPVPTVRLPGMRRWNEYLNVPLEQRLPDNETGDMMGISRKNPDAPPVPVPYRRGGHLIRQNNNEILSIAERAAFLYRITGEPRYAKLAADVFWPWLLGTYYMNPPLDPSGKSGGPGGYAPGGIMGYYDYEQIHDDLQTHGAVIYDLLYDWLNAHPHPHLAVIGKSLTETAGIVLKRFIDIGFVRGGKSGNWNVNGWCMMFPSIIALEPDAFYPDGKGREYYLKHFTTISTDFHDALPDILKQYDPVTGLWPEAPGYALGTVGGIMHFALILQEIGIDIIRDNPILQKAVDANFIWMDERGNLVPFGDCRANPADFAAIEKLLRYYTRAGQPDKALQAAAVLTRAIHEGRYQRNQGSWYDLAVRTARIPAAGTRADYRAAWSPFHRHLLLRNPAKSGFGLMAALYGGRRGWHLASNGLAWQFYADGWCVAPDAAAYESYWTPDYAYHQQPTGSNTILPGYASGPVVLNAVGPRIAPGEFTAEKAICPEISFADMTASEKRRTIALVRSSDTAGYYVDVFRSRQNDNDYLHHNIGTQIQASQLTLQPIAAISPARHPSYSYFKNIRHAVTDAPLALKWTVTPELTVSLWMNAVKGSELFVFDAPPTALTRAAAPNGVSCAPNPTPSVIVRRRGDGWRTPFAAVFSADNVERRIASRSEGEFTVVEVATPSLNGRKEMIFVASDDLGHKSPERGWFVGSFGTVCTDRTGIRYLYLGNGEALEYGGWKLNRLGEWGEAILRFLPDGTVRYTSDVPVRIAVPGERRGRDYPAAQDGTVVRPKQEKKIT